MQHLASESLDWGEAPSPSPVKTKAKPRAKSKKQKTARKKLDAQPTEPAQIYRDALARSVFRARHGTQHGDPAPKGNRRISGNV
jgi:hypothetical protein